MYITQLFPQKTSRTRRFNESVLLEEPVYRNFKRIGQYIAERKLTEPEIFKVFADAETGMTDRATGANRTFLGRGKDTTMDFAGSVADSLKTIWSDIQGTSIVAGVDALYDQATDALGDLVGGEKGAVMSAIKKYRMLAKQYPKTAGIAKGALLAITGLATGGAGLPAAAALIYGLDAAVKGEKFSDIALKAGGAAATAWAAGKIASAFGGDQAAAGAEAGGMGDPSQLPPFDDAGNLAPGFHINPKDGIPYYNGELAPTPADIAAGYGPGGAAGGGGGTYTIQSGDQLGYIAQANGSTVEQIRQANPGIDFSKPLKPGMEIQLPSAGTPGQGSVYQGYQGGMYGDKPTGTELLGGPGAPGPAAGGGSTGGAAADQATIDASQAMGQGMVSMNSLEAAVAAQDAADAAAQTGAATAPQTIDYTKPGPMSTDSMGTKLEYGIPVNNKGAFVPPNPNLPADELARQTAAYDAWKADFMKRFPSATQLPDGTMQGIKPGLAPMYPGFPVYTPKAGALPESIYKTVKLKTLPADQLIDQRLTKLSWALNESIGKPPGRAVHLTSLATYTVFENIQKLAELDKKKPLSPKGFQSGPGDPTPLLSPAELAAKAELPDLYRPDAPEAPVTPDPKPGLIGRGLNALDRGAKAVGGALGTVGRQFTSNVTKEKLKMNWHLKGKPSDSDELAAWLVTQKVPQQVIIDVYSKMGIPLATPTPTPKPKDTNPTPPPAPKDTNPTPPPAPKDTNPTPAPIRGMGGSSGIGRISGSTEVPSGVINPVTKKPYTYQELRAMGSGSEEVPQPEPSPAPDKTPAPAPVSGPAKSKLPQPTTVGQPMTVSYGKGFEKYMKPKATTQFPNFGTAGQTPAYKPATTKTPVPAQKSKVAATAESIDLSLRIAQALKKPVKEMLELAETKDDIRTIKQFIDQTFIRYNAVDQAARTTRNKLVEHVSKRGEILGIKNNKILH